MAAAHPAVPAASPLSTALRFYVLGGKDDLGRTHEEMMAYSDDRCEGCHDWIQTFFPTAEPSHFASVFPQITEADAAALQASPEARARMQLSAKKFMDFLGVAPGAVDRKKWGNWAHDGNHNLLRVTRAIRSLRLFGEEDAARAFHAAVDAAADEMGLSPSTREFWAAALTAPPMQSMRDVMRARRRGDLPPHL